MCTKDEHRAFIQLVQEEAAAFGMETNLKARRSEKTGKLFAAEFFVFWNEEQLLALENNPMQEGALWTIYPERWERIKAEAANALAKS